MPWTPPPSFADGELLSATKLNILTEDLLYLKGLNAAPNLPLFAYVWKLNASIKYWIRHKFRYLHFRYRVESDPGDHFSVRLSESIRVFHDGSPVAEGDWPVVVDLNDQTTWSDYTGIWDIGTNYSKYAVVLYSSKYYVSLQNSSLGNTPPAGTVDSWWLNTGLLGDAYSVGTYYDLFVDGQPTGTGVITLKYLEERDTP